MKNTSTFWKKFDLSSKSLYTWRRKFILFSHDSSHPLATIDILFTSGDKGLSCPLRTLFQFHKIRVVSHKIFTSNLPDSTIFLLGHQDPPQCKRLRHKEQQVSKETLSSNSEYNTQKLKHISGVQMKSFTRRNWNVCATKMQFASPTLFQKTFI